MQSTDRPRQRSRDALLSEAEARHVEMGITPEMKVEIDAARGLLRAVAAAAAGHRAWAASAAAALRDDRRHRRARRRAAASLSVYRSQLSRHRLDAWADIDELQRGAEPDPAGAEDARAREGGQRSSYSSVEVLARRRRLVARARPRPLPRQRHPSSRLIRLGALRLHPNLGDDGAQRCGSPAVLARQRVAQLRGFHRREQPRLHRGAQPLLRSGRAVSASWRRRSTARSASCATVGRSASPSAGSGETPAYAEYL